MKRRGFTLVEISIYVTLAALFLIGAYRLFISSRRTYTVTTQNMITNEQARKIINFLNFELRRANHVQEPPLLESETDVSDENSTRLVYIIQRADPSRNPTAGRIFQQTSVELEVSKNEETGLCELNRKKIEYDYNGNASATEESVLYGDIDELKFWRMKNGSEVDFIVTPTTPVPAFPIDAETVTVGDIKYAVKGPGRGSAVLGRNTFISNHVGLPSITVPCGYTAEGLPIGLQFVGRAFNEDLLFRIAYRNEMTLPRRTYPPTHLT